MNHLIVYAHPSSDSFSNKIMNVAKEFSSEKEYKTEVRDLYAIGFDPILKISDIKGIRSNRIPEDIEREKNYIEWADVITFIYPIWWTGMPAILKGYIDKVFLYGMTYKKGNSGSGGLLKGKMVFLFSPMGTSNETYGKSGMLDSMKQTCDESIFKFCGMKVFKHVFFGEASSINKEMEKEYLKAIPLVFSKGFSSNKCNENEKNKQTKNDESNKEEKGTKENKNNNEQNKDSSEENNNGNKGNNRDNGQGSKNNNLDNKSNNYDNGKDKVSQKNSKSNNEKNSDGKSNNERSNSEKSNNEKSNNERSNSEKGNNERGNSEKDNNEKSNNEKSNNGKGNNERSSNSN